MNRLAKEGLLDRLTKVKLPKYESSLVGKATVKSCIGKTKSQRTYSLWHLAMNLKERHEIISFLTFMYDYSQRGYVYLLSHRYEALDVFKYFVAKVET